MTSSEPSVAETGIPDAGSSPSSAPGTATPAEKDRELLRRHVDGDPDAFTELVRAHSNRAWAVALGMLRDREDAADAVQEAMLSAYRGAAAFRGEASVATWLHRIVVNACLDRLRRRAARPQVPLPAGDGGSGSGSGGAGELAEPRDAIVEGETRLAVESALGRLPETLRLAVVLVDIQGWSVAEASALLAVPVGTVKSRCARGRAKLAVMLDYLRPGNPAALDSVSQSRHVNTSKAVGGGVGDDS
ncbi:ECF subfamily RNA polymerase sigma-24 factor [Candidatus Protofrankia californiensis]|uniref:ECF subfamily RNA polymerase sigma-24 factor n=1 Tax=Candidatus Protofrankia californiensis TaxID=1839754 RepID=A0A1C3PH44_9ACTN|nr:ECF subfamily RNA polymerase sigma-24 factor [Candidatus Protofrankia californiensis]